MMFKTMLFSNFLYMSIHIFVTLSAIFVKNWMNNWNLLGQNYSFYQYKHDFSCYFHDFEKKSVNISCLSLQIHSQNFGMDKNGHITFGTGSRLHNENINCYIGLPGAECRVRHTRDYGLTVWQYKRQDWTLDFFCVQLKRLDQCRSDNAPVCRPPCTCRHGERIKRTHD
jgi:hypothetical protein